MRAPEPAGRALDPGDRALESARRVSGPVGMALKRAPEPAERALEPAERALESAGRPFEASWEAQSHLGGPAGNSRGDGERQTDTERSVPSMWWYHRSLSPYGAAAQKWEEELQ